jgi:hypothetical protein
MKLTRTIKQTINSPKRSWKPQEFELEDICQPDVPKLERPMIVWGQCYPNFSDTLCFDYDNLEPSEFMVNLIPNPNNKLKVSNSNDNLLNSSDTTNSVFDCVLAIMESSSGNSHVLVKIANKLHPNNYKNIYETIAKELGSNYDSKCCDLFRGFFVPNKIVYVNENCLSYKVKLEVSQTNNLLNSSDTINSKEIGEFIKGNRNNFITQTLCKMVREKQDVGDWLEDFAYPYVEPDFEKEEIDNIIKWIRKTYKGRSGKKKIVSNGKTKKFGFTFGLYRQYRMDGKTHLVAWTSVSQTMSMATQKRYRSKYNKEHGITEKKSGKKGRTWKCKKRKAKNNDKLIELNVPMSVSISSKGRKMSIPTKPPKGKITCLELNLTKEGCYKKVG